MTEREIDADIYEDFAVLVEGDHQFFPRILAYANDICGDEWLTQLGNAIGQSELDDQQMGKLFLAAAEHQSFRDSIYGWLADSVYGQQYEADLLEHAKEDWKDEMLGGMCDDPKALAQTIHERPLFDRLSFLQQLAHEFPEHLTFKP